MTNHWLEEARKRLNDQRNLPPGVGLDRLREQGVINEQGEVTGKLHRWQSDFAIVAVKASGESPKINQFRCLKPVFGMPGGATIDISRDNLVRYLREGKQVITAHYDARLKMWKEGAPVILSPQGFFVLDDAMGDGADDVGELPTFQHSTSRL